MSSSPTPSLRSISAFVGLMIPSTLIVPILLISLSVSESCGVTQKQLLLSLHGTCGRLNHSEQTLLPCLWLYIYTVCHWEELHMYQCTWYIHIYYLLSQEQTLCWQDGEPLPRTIFHCGVWYRLVVCALCQMEKMAQLNHTEIITVYSLNK